MNGRTERWEERVEDKQGDRDRERNGRMEGMVDGGMTLIALHSIGFVPWGRWKRGWTKRWKARKRREAEEPKDGGGEVVGMKQWQ